MDLKDGKDVLSKLNKLSDSIDPLAWIQSSIKKFKQLIGHDDVPLRYVICSDVAIDKDYTDRLLLDKKCYSDKHGLLQNEMIAKQTYDGGVYNHKKTTSSMKYPKKQALVNLERVWKK